MSTISGAASAARRPDPAVILPVAFGTTVAMWIVGYVCRLPAIQAPGWLVLGLMLALMVGGGYVVGRISRGGWIHGLATGFLTALLNMLILGSLLSGERPGTLLPSAIVWLPGALGFGALAGVVGALLGEGARPSDLQDAEPGTHVSRFAQVAALATMALVGIGGVVTSTETGLAVVDWPNSFGYNMFLYPLSRMTGGIYYEHAHRLFGSLVGLTTLTLTGMILVRDPRPSVKVAGFVASLLVILQGILGGLRVTGTFTLSTAPEDMTPSTLLAMVHGVTGQLFFALLVGIAVAASPTFRGGTPARATKHASGERTFSALLVAALVVQLVLGAYYRHTGAGLGLTLHISGATLVAIVALVVGLRVWGLHGQGEGSVSRLLGRLGVTVMTLLGIQLCLGMAALAAIMARAEGEGPGSLEVVFATAHQLTGALLLAASVATALWVRRLLVEAEEGAD